jgi:hypothetical protein
VAFKRGPAGTIVLRLSAAERGLLRGLATDLDRMLAADDPGGAGAALGRLFPDAYPDDAPASAEFRRFTEGELLDGKRRNAAVVLGTLDSPERRAITIPEPDAQSWLRSLTDLRLTLAARLGIEEDGDEGRISWRDPNRQVYMWLGYLQETLVRAIDATAE